MENFLSELESGEIHLRDKWQLELKSEFFPLPTKQKNKYTQEFYIFIPNSLHINERTYTKADFFRDQTNYIRYKTPVFTFETLSDLSNSTSPFYKIYELLNCPNPSLSAEIISDECKLLGNIIRSTLRKRVFTLSKLATSDNFHAQHKHFYDESVALNRDLTTVRNRISDLKKAFFDKDKNLNMQSRRQFLYFDEFVSNSIHHYLTGLLNILRSKDDPETHESDLILSTLIITEDKHRDSISSYPEDLNLSTDETEFISYRSSLLNKFVLDALMLNLSRSSPDKGLKTIIGSVAAGIAMLVYFSLFIWQGQVLLINSELFILGTVILYILKDRLKEGLKSSSYKLAFRWFSDYKTKIKTSDNKQQLGTLKEFFSYVSVKKIPEEILRVRNKEFHYVLEEFHRPEKVIRYKKTIEMAQSPKKNVSRRYSLNLIFRFNILKFLEKADNPYHTYYTINHENHEFNLLRLPKTYHVNIIIKNTFMTQEGQQKTEIKKFRLVLDKNGIKRVEQVG
jgi:hypothetical protein